MKIDPDKCPQATAARMLGVSVRHFQRLKPPRNTDGSYNLADVFRWRLQSVEDKALGDDMGDGRSEALERMREARAAIYEIDLAERRAEVLDATEVRIEVARAAETCKRVLLQIAPKVAPQVVGARVEDAAQLIDGCVRDALDELCQTLKVEEPPAPAA